MDASTLPKGQSSEETPGRKQNMPGVYRHEAAGKEVITTADPNDGVIQADALVRLGYRRVGDVPSRKQLHEMRAKQLAKDLADLKAGKILEGELGEFVENGTATPSVTDLKAQLEAQRTARLQAEEALAALAPKDTKKTK